MHTRSLKTLVHVKPMIKNSFLRNMSNTKKILLTMEKVEDMKILLMSG